MSDLVPTRLAAEIFHGFRSQPLPFEPEPPFLPCNPSIHFDGRMYRCIVRCINYRLGHYCPEEPETKNVMLELDPANDWAITRTVPMADKTGVPKSGYPISGFEDCRLFTWGGNLWASATTCHLTPEGNRELVLLEIDHDDYSFKRLIPMRGPWSTHYQKNWIPVPGILRQFIYEVDRALWFSFPEDNAQPRFCYENGQFKHVNDVDWTYEHGKGLHRGSSQALRMSVGSFLVLVHTEEYQSKFMRLDAETLRPTHMTERFHFRELNVEFATGIAMRGRTLIASYSVRDSTAELGFFHLDSILQAMEVITP